MSGDDWPDEWAGPPTTSDDARRRVDDLLYALADKRRRDLVYHLDAVEITDLETLAARLAATRESVPVDAVPADVRERVQVDLRHNHLPKLENAGVIEFDARSEVVRCRNFPPTFERFVEACRDVEARK